MGLAKISNKLKNAVKLSTLNQYTIAHDAGMSQSMISQLMNGIVIPQDNDERVIAVGKVLGLESEDCFE